jgi:hypothetical protein
MNHFSLEIAYFYFFTHLSQAFRKLINKIHLNAEVDRKIGILVSGVDGFSDVEVDVRRFFKQHTADQRRAVSFKTPMLVVFVFS